MPAACSTLRHVMGITTPCCTTRSFMRMKSAARLTGSISTSASRQSRSKSAFRQRAMFRPVHLFSRDGSSQETNWAMNIWGSRPVKVV